MSARLLTATVAALAAGLIGCGTPPPRAEAPPEQAAVPAPTVPPPAPTPFAGADIPVATLLELARRATPSQAVFAANRAAAAAAVTQAGAWANPEVEVGIGRARAREVDETGSRSSTTIGGVRLSQRFELSGKRSSRIAAAETGRTLVERAAAVDALELDLEVRAAAVAVALADRQAVQATRALTLAGEVHAAVQARHRAGESDQGDLARATVELTTARLAEDAATRDGVAARAALRSWCGDALPTHFTIADALPELPEALQLADAQAQARSAHPRLALLDARSGAAAASAASEERAWYPDLTVGVSGSREADTDDFGVSLGMEIPLWNRNRGGIDQAQADLARVAAERRQELVQLERQVLAAWSAYERERHQIAGLAQDLLPAARDALRLKMSAYEAGDAALFDLIEARRGLLAGEQALLEARSRTAQARIELARAIGAAPSASLPPSTTPRLPTGALP